MKLNVERNFEVGDHLDIFQARTVVDLDKGEGLGIPSGAHPSLDEYRIEGAFAVEQPIDFASLHGHSPWQKPVSCRGRILSAAGHLASGTVM